MKKLLLSGVGILLSLPAVASLPELNVFTNPTTQIATTKAWIDPKDGTLRQANVNKLPEREPQNPVTVTVNMTMPTDLTAAFWQFAFRTDVADGEKAIMTTSMNFNKQGPVTFSIEPGTYDFLINFDGFDGNRLIALENVKVEADMTLEADASEAINHISFKPIMPDGEELRCPSTYEGVMDFTDANIQQGFAVGIIAHSMFGPFTSNVLLLTDSKYSDGTKYNMLTRGDYFINGCEHFNFAMGLELAIKELGCASVLLVAPGAEDGTVSNQPSDYSPWVTTNVSATPNKFKYTHPVGTDLSTAGNLITWDNVTFNAAFLRAGQNFGKWKDDSFSVCMPSEMPAWAAAFNIIPQTAINDISFNNDYYGIIVPPASYIGDGDYQFIPRTIENVVNNAYYYYGWTNNNQDAYNSWYLDDNYAYTYNEAPNAVYGNNAPILFLLRTGEIEYCYVGNYGEFRTIDVPNTSVEVEYNGNLVCDDYFALEDMWAEEREPGTYDITLVNDNFIIDDIQGSNTSFTHFDSSLSDRIPPVLRMAQLRNDNLITNTANTADKFTLTFSANKYRRIIVDDVNWTGYYEPEQVESIKVEYAPNGTKDFKELQYESAGYFFPDFGNTYRIALSQVTGQSANGWFDIRFTLKDAFGNSQTQTISPFFKISDLTGEVNSIMAGSEVIQSEYYDTTGRKIKNLAKGSIMIRVDRLSDGTRSIAKILK